MENIKEKIPFIIGITILIALCIFAYYVICEQVYEYYTKIDNSKIQTLPATEDMNYEYTLTCYTEQGKSREIKFKTSRQLREGAYLKLEFLNIAGVRNWEEVQLEELPEKVRTNYQK